MSKRFTVVVAVTCLAVGVWIGWVLGLAFLGPKPPELSVRILTQPLQASSVPVPPVYVSVGSSPGSINWSLVAQITALPLSLLVAWFATNRTMQEARRAQVGSEIVTLLKDVQILSEKVTTDMQNLLVGKPSGGANFKSARVSITLDRKKCDSKMQTLAMLLPSKAHELQQKHSDWYTKVFQNGFVTGVANAKEIHDPQVINVQSAQQELEQFLAVIRLDCLKRKLVA